MIDLDALPNGADYSPPERIVAACNRYGNILLPGVRHGSDDMYNVADAIGINAFKELVGTEHDQGFITSKYRFVDRVEAWKIAVDRNQIVRRVGGDTANGGTLYSENLW